MTRKYFAFCAKSYKDCEDPDAKNSEIKAVSEGHGDSGGNSGVVSGGLVPRSGGQQDHSQGVYQGRWKEDKRHRHACESSICTDGLGTGESVDGQALRDHDRLRALQKVQDETVCHEWGSEGQEGGHGREQIAREIRNSFGIPEKRIFYGTLANPAGSACIFVKLMK